MDSLENLKGKIFLTVFFARSIWAFFSIIGLIDCLFSYFMFAVCYFLTIELTLIFRAFFTKLELPSISYLENTDYVPKLDGL